MDFVQAVVLALVQGLTEFLPISSSAHLILVRKVSGWAEGGDGPAFDVAVHVGSLIAVLWFFRATMGKLATAWLASLRGRHSADSRLGWLLILATIPAAAAGLLAKDAIESELRTVTVIATTSIVFGALLWLADVAGKRRRDDADVGLLDAIGIGLAQALALIPGTSRSGATITAGLFFGLTRSAAARFSFLMSIPIILAAGTLKAKDCIGGEVAVDWGLIALGVVVSAGSAYLCIDVFMRLIERIGMLPFVIYRVLLGIALFLFV